MSAEPKYRKGDLVDIVFRKAVVADAYDSGLLSIVHSDQEMNYFNPAAIDVETTVVGYDSSWDEEREK